MPVGALLWIKSLLSRASAACLHITVVLAVISVPGTPRAQAGFEDNRVMLQGFYWEPYRHGHPAQFPNFGSKHWYRIVEDQAGAMREARFDLIWLPPPSYAGDLSAGYNPKEYYRLDNSYGGFDEHRSMLVALLTAGVEPVADVVINHRDGSRGWADFRNPDWGTWAITRGDEAFNNRDSEVFGRPIEQRGAEEEQTAYASGGGGAASGSSAYPYPDFRDIDHTNRQVRHDLIRYLLQLRGMGYRGWRYDMVHGYHARWVAVYNRASAPTFSVGEYEWGDRGGQRGWVWNTATSPGRLETASSVFDFTTHFELERNKGNYRAWYGSGGGLGMVGDSTDGVPWRNRAVTFLENHDTGYRTNPNGTPQANHQFDSFANGPEVEQGYAQILTHPGVPTVYWKHYFDWGPELRGRIRALINARKAAGVHAGSAVHPQDNARDAGVYAARIVGRNGDLYVRIGGDDTRWRPSDSGYADYREYATGAGWTVWVGLPGNPQVREAPLRPALPVPTYREAPTIDVPNHLLD